MMRTFAALTLLVLLCVPAVSQSTASAPPAASLTSAVAPIASAMPAAAAFEIADVHVSPHHNYPFPSGGVLRGDRYALQQATMVDLIAAAYGVDTGKVQGGPSWLEMDRFDVIAKAPAGTSKDTIRLMLQALLAERFGLVLHNGSAPMPAYVLTTGSSKPKLASAEGTEEAGCQPAPGAADGAIPSIRVICHNLTMEAFAEQLHQMASGYLTEPLVDATGLSGAWDFDLKWTPRGALQKAGPDGISIFDAVDKQLGLKLELKTAPRPVLVVDHVNRTPSANPPGLEKRMPAMPTPHFDVAVIKPSKPGTNSDLKIQGSQVDAHGVTLKLLMSFAWDFNRDDDEIPAGAPKWLGTDQFDILAKAPGEMAGDPSAHDARVDLEYLREMLQALLVERFQMKVHTEQRTISAYTLVAANPKLHPADPSSRTRCKEGPGPDGKDPRLTNPVLNRLLTCQNMTMAQIGEELRHVVGGYIYGDVQDATGLTGAYDFTLSFSSIGHMRPASVAATSAASEGAAAEPSGAVSLFEAVNKQLGLKLEKQKRLAPVLVIDHIEEVPTEN